MTEPVSNNRQLSEMSDAKLEEIAQTCAGKLPIRFGLDATVGFIRAEAESIVMQALRETRRETLLEAAEICNMVCEKIAAAKNQAGNTEEGRALQRCVWTAFACEQQILLLIDNDAKKAAELRKAKEIDHV